MMTFFANRDINRLAAHLTLVSVAWSLAGIFFMVFLLRAGLPPTQIFLLTAIASFQKIIRVNCLIVGHNYEG